MDKILTLLLTKRWKKKPNVSNATQKKINYKYIIKICHEQHDIAKKKVYFVIRVNKHLSSPPKMGWGWMGWVLQG